MTAFVFCLFTALLVSYVAICTLRSSRLVKSQNTLAGFGKSEAERRAFPQVLFCAK